MSVMRVLDRVSLASILTQVYCASAQLDRKRSTVDPERWTLDRERVRACAPLVPARGSRCSIA
jgi:hypothetical protein